MPTLAPSSADGGDSSSGADDGGHSSSQEINSVRELNRLLESALRMGGEGLTYPTMSGGGSSGGGATTEENAMDTASWRLDTARRLSSLLSSQNPHNNTIPPSNNDENNNDNDLLLPALRRQTRYWIPLLLSWLKGGGTNEEYNNENGSLDLPLTSKQRRQQQQRNKHNNSNSGSGSNNNNNSPPEVQIEALRALTALTEWTARENESGQGDQGHAGSNNGNANGGGGGGEKVHPHVTIGHSPHTPLSTSSQRLLLRHSDAVPMIVSLLSSNDAAVHEQAVWILGSIASSGLGATALPPSAKAARAAAAEMTKLMENGDGTVTGVAVPSAAAQQVGDGSNTTASTNTEDDGPSLSASSRGKDKTSVSARDVIFASGAMEPLLKCLSDNPKSYTLHRLGAWCLSSLVEGRYSGSSSSSSSSNDNNNNNSSSNSNKGKSSSSSGPSAAEEIDVLTLLPTMKRMLYMDDVEILTFACWTLSHLCDGPAYHIAAVIYSETSAHNKRKQQLSPANGLVPRLVELLLHPSPKVAKPALRTIGNIVCADCTDQCDQFGNQLPVVDFTEIILECEAVPCLRQLVGHPNREIQKEACWTLSNIAAGTASQIQSVIDSGAIPPLVDLVNNELTDKEVRSEACWVVLNATSCGNDEQIATLIEEGCVSVLGVLLTEPNMVMMALEGIERVLQTEEAQDSEDLYHKSEEELGQRPTILRCAALIKTVTESPHNSSAVSKRARRIWEHHFVSCALCHNNYSRCRLQDSHFCNECKCHVCSKCDCRVYHLSYQEELWAEDEEKAMESKKNKKSKKQKKKQKMKEKAAEKKKLESQQQQQEEQQQQARAEAEKKDAPAAATPTKEKAQHENNKSKKEPTKAEPTPEKGKSKKKNKGTKSNAAANTTRKSPSTSPSRGTIESSDAADSLGGDGGAGTHGEDSTNPLGSGGLASGAAAGVLNEEGNEPIDLVLYLQQTGSIIALAKLMDSLYDDEYEDDVVEGEDGNNRSGGSDQKQQQQQKRNIGRNHRVLSTQ